MMTLGNLTSYVVHSGKTSTFLLSLRKLGPSIYFLKVQESWTSSVYKLEIGDDL